MRFLDVNGNPRFRNIEKYRMNWDKPSRSNAQFRTKQFLKRYWQHHVCYEEMPVYGSRLSVDIVNVSLKIAIEVQGGQHEDFNEFFHKGSRRKYFRGIQNDLTKRQWLENNGFVLYEIYDHETTNLTPEFFREKFRLFLV